MIFGKKQTLVMIKRVEFGIYLAETMKDAENKVLLPKKQVPADMEVGDPIDVFLYKDSNDRPIATVKEPKLTLGQTARLRVVSVGKVGAFLDWGLEKDLFLPFKQQKVRVKKGDTPLVSLYIDKSGRLCATMNVYENLRSDSPYQKDDRVTGVIYETSPEFGMFVAVDDLYSALIPKKEAYGDLKVGDTVNARVTSVKEDGRLNLSVREKAYLQIETDAEKVLKVLDSFDGAMPFNDKASPEVIKRELQMSKNEFKRAVGHLLKNGMIEIGEKSIRRK